MKQLPPHFFEGKHTLDIGCGRNKMPGSVGLDQFPFSGVDVVSNLEQTLPFKDCEFDLVFANQLLEHISDLTGLLVEIHRILKPNGYLLAHVPYFRSSWAHIDPTHVRSFTIESLDYYVRGTWLNDVYRFTDISYVSCQKFLDLDYKSNIPRRLFSYLALKNPSRYENSFLSFAYPFEQLTFLLQK